MENSIYKWMRTRDIIGKLIGFQLVMELPNLWMVYVMENPIYKWMRTRGTPMTQETTR